MANPRKHRSISLETTQSLWLDSRGTNSLNSDKGRQESLSIPQKVIPASYIIHSTHVIVQGKLAETLLRFGKIEVGDILSALFRKRVRITVSRVGINY